MPLSPGNPKAQANQSLSQWGLAPHSLAEDGKRVPGQKFLDVTTVKRWGGQEECDMYPISLPDFLPLALGWCV